MRDRRGGLGRLVESHRPVARPAGWALTGAVCAPVAVVTGASVAGAVSVPAGLGIGLLTFAVLLGPVAYGLAEWLFLQHDLYEHALVLRSLPGRRRVIIPHHTIAPDSIRVTSRQRHHAPAGQAVVARSTPLLPQAVRFEALTPDRTRPHSVHVPGGHRPAVRWVVSHRAPDWFQQLLTYTVLNSRHAGRQAR